MFSRSFSFKLLLVCVLIIGCSCLWSRRRRRRAPPTPVDCVVSGWSSWTECTEKCTIGKHTKTRTITVQPRFGGDDCPTLEVTEDCGTKNGGCNDYCKSDGTCDCRTMTGYKLAADGKSCEDQDECTDGSHSCVKAKCTNAPGSYTCQCLDGYETVSSTRCSPRSCSLLTPLQCPAGAYHDGFGAACKAVQVNYPDGKEFLKKAKLTCSTNYKLAIIAQPSGGKKFAQDYSTVDYQTPHDQTTCVWHSASGNVIWDWDPQTTPYYCRRVNDPPGNIVLSNARADEKERILTEVGHFVASDPQNNQLVFTIENPEGHNDFLIQGDRLQIKRVLIWSPRGTNTRVVAVNVTDNGSPPMYSQTIFNITIININDPPRDLELSNNQVSENIATGSIVGNLTAIDDDVGPERSSNFSWELVDSDNGFFDLRGNAVVVVKQLDHETKNLHKIKVRCSDFQESRQTSITVEFLINVRNENDSPKSLMLTKQNVAENSPVGFLIGTLKASDDDYENLTFSLNGSSSQALQKFRLKNLTSCRLQTSQGKQVQTCSVDLIVIGDLDYEEQDEYDLWVSVSDSGGVTRKKFIISVGDVNEVATDVIITTSHVFENSPAGTVIGELLVTDPDDKKGRRQTQTCSLTNSQSGDEDSFTIVKTNARNLLQVKDGKSLDFESKSSYNITVKCTDEKGLSLTKSFVITVTDVNESPTSLSLSNTTINENQPGVSVFGMLSATDPEGDGQSFLYAVISSSSGHFMIGGPNRDQLLVNGSLDYEKATDIDVGIRVTDQGGLHLDKSFTLTITDVNDAPSDIILEPNATIKENSGPQVYIGRINVVDQDKGERHTCRLLNSSNDRVTLNDLILLVGKIPTDYESLMKDSKSLKILLNCADSHGATIEKWISVPVQDVNESPTDLILTNRNVHENRKYARVGILRIVDPDTDQRHNCSVLSNGRTPLFHIDNSIKPPVLRTAQHLDFETSKKHAVDIRCEDIVKDTSEGRPVIERQFIIDVIDINEEPTIRCDVPFFISPSFSAGSVIGLIQGYDPDNEEYFRSKKVDARKQLLTYRFEPENSSVPIDITADGIMYLDRPLNEDEYNGSIVMEVHVEDDGILLQLINGSYHIIKSFPKQYFQRCRIIISSNLTYKDIHLSSNYIYENATNGTVIGKLSRNKTSLNDTITYHVIGYNGPFVVDGDHLLLSSRNSLDYERLPPQKILSVNISSYSSVSGIFTKQFLIKILDVNEEPTAICLLSPQPLEECTVVGHILIEDPDYPDLKCEDREKLNIKHVQSELSEYSCRVDEGEDVLSNQVNIGKFSVVKKLTLMTQKSSLTQAATMYNVTLVCQNVLYPVHLITTTLSIPIQTSNDPTCRDSELCDKCPQPKFCLSHVLANQRCVGEDFRINSIVEIPGSYFESDSFILEFELYIVSLLEGTSNGKTLKQLMSEFDDTNKAQSSRRRRRRETYTDVYVELFVFNGFADQTSVVFAVAEMKKDFELIPRSDVCKLLKSTEIECPSENTGKIEGEPEGTSGFPFWVIYLIIGLVVLLIVCLVVFWRRRQLEKKKNNSATVHFSKDSDTMHIHGAMYDTPIIPDDIDDSQADNVSSFQNDSSNDPVLVDVRRDIKVFDNPMYRPRSPEAREDSTRSVNHYEQAEPIYSTIDDDVYDQIEEEQRPKRNKSRSNPVYNMEGGEDDTLNPVVNLAVSPRKTLGSDKMNEGYIDSADDTVFEEGGTSTFKKTRQPDDSPQKRIGVANPIYVSDVKTVNDNSEKSDDGPPSAVKNDLYGLERDNEQRDKRHSSC